MTLDEKKPSCHICLNIPIWQMSQPSLEFLSLWRNICPPWMRQSIKQSKVYFAPNVHAKIIAFTWCYFMVETLGKMGNRISHFRSYFQKRKEILKNSNPLQSFSHFKIQIGNFGFCRIPLNTEKITRRLWRNLPLSVKITAFNPFFLMKGTISKVPSHAAAAFYTDSQSLLKAITSGYADAADAACLTHSKS